MEKGFITSQVIIEPQDLNSGKLVITVVPGRVSALHIQAEQANTFLSGHTPILGNIFPIRSEDILNLHRLEQGLENLHRLSTVESNIRIEPSEKQGYSDIAVTWQQSKPFLVTLGLDDSGSKATGKNQFYTGFSLDNPLRLGDFLHISYRREIGHKRKLTDSEGNHTGSRSRSYSLHYSLPVKNWLFSFNHSHYRYHEATEGFYRNYDYSGKSINSRFDADRVIYRDGRHKTIAGLWLWRQQIHKYIDDSELEVQRRRSAGWAAGLRHKSQLGQYSLYGAVTYKRGTGMLKSLKAPEEYDSNNGTIGGTSRMKVITAELAVAAPFKIGRQLFTADSNLNLQWNKTPLTPQDKLSLGGRYTVRGFDGEQSITGERGWYWQNNLGWHYRPSHQVYLGIDSGHVSGRSTEGLDKQRLTGAALGIKGSIKAGGMFHYDVYAAKPLDKPDHFQTAKTVYNFNLYYRF
ncbi:ShlB/FhaC/HecB family hemolysin secretion/activation protein [Neisseria iguanae]|uniref:ShlB/FhaC/HecB family hemolysin secretion/activation protein n=1 Tax=Neisseria iguanae TaxID=90242 RepID=UPI001FE5C7E0|nr:ShlB/FhaC/HecB family hemolysin secretion/activation protein [Neisseria iguanae]